MTGDTNDIAIGFLHGFNSYPPSAGAAVHVNQFLTRFGEHGLRVHTFDYDKTPGITVHPATRLGMLALTWAVRALYVRIDGGLSQEYVLRSRVLRVIPRRTVWEINAPVEEAGAFWLTDKDAIRRCEDRRRQLAGGVSAACCVSEELVDYAREDLGIARAFYIPNGSDPDVFRPERGDARLYPGEDGCLKILWTGSTRYPWQGHRTVLRLAEHVRLSMPAARFTIVGDPRYLEGPIPENVRVVGEVPYAQVPGFIAGADVCLCVYERCEWSRLGFYFSPLKLFDYMACGRAVIGSARGEIQRVLQDGKNGFHVGEAIEDMAALLKHLQDHPEVRQRVGEEARRTVIERYNWARSAGQTAAVIREVVDG